MNLNKEEQNKIVKKYKYNHNKNYLENIINNNYLNHYFYLTNINNHDNINIDNGKTATFLNSTYDDYHHGCSGTSYIIKHKIEEFYDKYDIITISEIRDIHERIITIDQFDNEDYFKEFSSKYSNIINKLNSNDSVIVNGEGCISHYNENTTTLLYLLYISKVYLKKHVFLINTSICNSDFIENIDKSNLLKFNQMLIKVLNKLDYISVREIFSYNYTKSLGIINVVQAFDSLPLYIKYYYHKIDNLYNEKYILLTGGNNINKYNKNDIFKNIDTLKQKYQSAKIYYLVSNMPNGICNDDQEFYKIIKEYDNQIDLLIANTLDEWLTAIDNCQFLLSGRFHHSIASFMLNTNFAVYNTNTTKLIGMLTIINKLNNLIEQGEDIKRIIKNNKQNYYKEKCLQNLIIDLANNNYLFERRGN